MNKLNLRLSLPLGIIILMFFLITGCLKDHDIEVPLALRSTELTSTMTNAQFANGFGGCTGENKSPQLNWVNTPAGTKSFAVTIYDRDANSGAGFNHWLLIDIPASITSLSQDAGNFSGAKIPSGSIQTQTDAQVAGYVGVCPPAGETHHYEIIVYAVNSNTLGLTATASPAEVKAALASKTLASSILVVTAAN